MAEQTFLHQLIFTAEGVDPGAAQVRSLECAEGLSRPYAAEVELDAADPDFDPSSLLLKSAEVLVDQGGAVLRRFRGVVTRTREVASDASGRTRFTVTIEPRLAVLRLSADHRIFQEQTTQQIVETLLGEAGIEGSEFRLSGSYPTREVCTQFGETHLAFISRLLEEDGIFYFFEHREGGDALVFGDSKSAYSATTPSDELPFRRASGLISEQAVFELRERDRVRPAKVTLRDHDFKRPALDLEASARDQAPLGREHYDHPGRYVDPGEGKRRAQVRLDAMACQARRVAGTSTGFSLTPGHTVKVTGAPDASLDREWVVDEVIHHWWIAQGAASFANRFELLPGDVDFRPPERSPRPRVRGPQVARVTGPKGEEIHCDEHGRVKVYFPWDRRSTRDEKSSAWVRVGQMHTSGSVAIPRVGWEVLIEFEDGDPDRPIVVGRLYNGIYAPPYKLPGGKTMSSLKSASTPGGGGHNEIRMEDGAGGEHLHVHAQKDLNLNVGNNKTETITTNALHSVGSNQTRTVGANETLEVSGQHGLTVGASQTWSVGGSRTKTIGGGESVTVTGSRTLSIGGSHTTMTPLTVGHSTPAAFSETVGGSCIEAAALGVSMAAAGVGSFTVGGSKVEVVATGKTDMTLGARASTVGGAFISASSGNVAVKTAGAKATTVGGAWAANAGGDVVLASKANVTITVGGAVALNAGSVALKVGGSTVTLAAGMVVIQSREIKLTATGPHAELAPMVEDI
ncbi:type VI secretion system tip protein TssI/VgrG [Sorangium sp. So ce1014]|uniref:type VI secretion system Vgr family protein n=1 Tax=Sorangium sp. So ce1014 TaxID=3133326 RepID=UPI003F636457